MKFLERFLSASKPLKQLFHPDPYPSKLVDGVISTNMCDVYSWQIAQRKKLASFIGGTAGFGECHCCGLPWFVVEGHTLWYSKDSGLFAVCEMCWHDLGPYGAWPYYEARIMETHPECVDALRENCFGSEGPLRMARSHLEL